MALLPYKFEVVTPATTKDLTVLATVKAELNITTVDAARDAFIGVLIQQASSKAVEMSGREFARETVRDTFRIEKCDMDLQLTRRPIASISSVTEDGTTVTSAGYEIIASTGWLRRIDSEGDPQDWLSGPVVVNYAAGWTLLTELPHALERIVIDEIKRRWFERERDPLVKSEEVPGVLSTAYWVNSGPPVKDPMLTALETAGFVDAIGI